MFFLESHALYSSRILASFGSGGCFSTVAIEVSACSGFVLRHLRRVFLESVSVISLEFNAEGKPKCQILEQLEDSI